VPDDPDRRARTRSETKDDYQIGYGKPPRGRPFPKGRPGNPCGRPPGEKNLKTLLADALDEPVAVTEDGRRHEVTKRELGIAQLVNKFTAADLRATKMLLDMLREVERRAQPPSPPEPLPFTAADEEVIQQLRERFEAAARAAAEMEVQP